MYIICLLVISRTVSLSLRTRRESEAMALYSCSLHTRLFSRRWQRWVPFSPATMQEIRGYDNLLRSTHTDASLLHVIERACDQCAVTLQTIARSQARQDAPGE